MPDQETAVFLSYSHADASLVAPVVKLLRVNKSLVFQDIDRIRPGKKWREEIADALAEAQLVVVFWCAHASRSDEVAREWKTAIEQRKDLLPLLLDATPLPAELSEYQWIDFRGTVGANHIHIDSAAAGPMAPTRSDRRLFGPILAAVAAGIAGVALFTTLQMNQSTAPDIAASSDPVPPIAESAPANSLVIAVSVALIATILVAWLLRRRAKRGKALRSGVQKASPRPEQIEQRIATELEAEILRRTTHRNNAKV